MKKFLLSLVMSVAAVFGATAADTFAHDASVLPEAARATIASNFKAKVSIVKIDKDFGRINEYEVILTDGSEIDFDRAGNWKNVETNRSVSVPSGFIAKPIQDYVKAKHPGTKVVGIEKKRSGYDVELNNGVDLKFNADGKFLKYDD